MATGLNAWSHEAGIRARALSRLVQRNFLQICILLSLFAAAIMVIGVSVSVIIARIESDTFVIAVTGAVFFLLFRFSEEVEHEKLHALAREAIGKELDSAFTDVYLIVGGKQGSLLPEEATERSLKKLALQQKATFLRGLSEKSEVKISASWTDFVLNGSADTMFSRRAANVRDFLFIFQEVVDADSYREMLKLKEGFEDIDRIIVLHKKGWFTREGAIVDLNDVFKRLLLGFSLLHKAGYLSVPA